MKRPKPIDVLHSRLNALAQSVAILARRLDAMEHCHKLADTILDTQPDDPSEPTERDRDFDD